MVSLLLGTASLLGLELVIASFGTGVIVFGDTPLAVVSPAVETPGGKGGSLGYMFLANRRTIWAIDKAAGRFAGYHFLDDEAHTVKRTGVVSLDQRDFPASDTDFLLSDRNLTELLWVGNRKTGDVQLWTPRLDGNVVGEKPLMTRLDLGAGEYRFLANRRTIWVVNETAGRFAGYHFRDDEARTVERTNVESVDRDVFPSADTVYSMSVRNLSEVLWTCNRTTGRMQLWTPRIGGEVVAQKPGVSGLGEGEYEFLVNRRTIWAINRTSARFVGCHFRNDEEHSVDRTGDVEPDPKRFAPQDTVYLTSDRDLTNVLWVCNKRTGDAQLRKPRFGGQVSGRKPIATRQDLGDGDYTFLANRKTIWAINKSAGRFAGFRFLDDDTYTVDRTRVVSLDQEDFPASDTVYRMSDRNLSEVLWVCNEKTGDVQFWAPGLGSRVVGEKPIATKEDLRRK